MTVVNEQSLDNNIVSTHIIKDAAWNNYMSAVELKWVKTIHVCIFLQKMEKYLIKNE